MRLHWLILKQDKQRTIKCTIDQETYNKMHNEIQKKLKKVIKSFVN